MRDLIVVVHLETAARASEQAELAMNAGADGVFLINHFGGPEVLEAALTSTRSTVGEAPWVGLNPLGLGPVAASTFVRKLDADVGRVDGLWCDNAETDERPGADLSEARTALELRAGWAGSYFGGVAFKYQRPISDLAAAADAAVPWMDVVCTSGPGTGQAADIAKVRELHEHLAGRRPLALASGVTIDNVVQFVPFVDFFVVATGVSHDYTHLDPDLISTLAGIISST